MPQIIAITNHKGGVGKTTTTVNLAAALALLGFRTLMVDLDPQGHCAQHLALEIEKDEVGDFDVLSVLQKKHDLQSCVYTTSTKNLFCLPGQPSLAEFNLLSPLGNQFLLREILETSTLPMDFILLDCQPSLSLLTLNGLTSCNWVILPVQAEFFALDGLSQLLVTFKEVQVKMHPKLQILGILLTMFDRRNRLSSEVKAELEENFPNELFEAVIPRNVKLAESPSFGKTIFEYDKLSPGADAYLLLAKEVLDRLDVV